MEQIQTILDYSVAGNAVLQWMIAAGVTVAVFIALEIVRKVVVSRLLKLAQKTHSNADDMVAHFLHNISWYVLLLIAIFFGLKGVTLPESIDLILDLTILLVLVSQVIKIAEQLASMLLKKHLQKNNADAEVPAIFMIAVRLVLWCLGGLLILSNAGVDITSLVAGLGIGGLAISLALQNILSDLFSSFSIAVDKPFVIGDYIVVGEHEGTVKHIGLKTTRITALAGEEIVISNAELTAARVQNYKRMERRRVVMSIGVTYDTPPEKLQKIDGIIKQAVEAQEHAEFDRCHFFEFGDSNLLFEAVYFVDSRVYATYMDTQEKINFAVADAFASEGIEMAYPTQTLYLKKEE